MSEHHHSLKRETFHETNPLLYQVLTKPTLGEHRPQRQRAREGEKRDGLGRRRRWRWGVVVVVGGVHPSSYEVKREKCKVLAGDQLRAAAP